MSLQTMILEEIRNVPIEEIIRLVLDQGEAVTIRVSDDQEVTINPKPRLIPLPVLEGHLPEGWKEAIYE